MPRFKTKDVTLVRYYLQGGRTRATCRRKTKQRSLKPYHLAEYRRGCTGRSGGGDREIYEVNDIKTCKTVYLKAVSGRN